MKHLLNALLPTALLTTNLALVSTAKTSVMCAIAPGAELAGYIDAVAMGQASIIESLETNPLYQQFEENSGSDEIISGLDLNEEDLTAAAFSLTGLEGAMQEDPTAFSFQFAVASAKPISNAQLGELLEQEAAEDGVTLTQTVIGGQTFFAGRKSPDEPELLFASLDNGTGSLVVGGSRKGMDALMTRHASGGSSASGPLTDALTESLPGRQGWLVLTLSETMRQQLKEQMDPNNPQAPPFAAVLGNYLAASEAVVVAAAASDTMTLQLGMQFPSEQQASEFTAFTNGLLDNMLRPMLQQQPEVPAAVKNMRFNASADYAFVDFALTESDLEALLQQAALMGPGAAPPPPAYGE
ncbi:MAG: hypothetical protein ACFBZ8_06645 [Opitutales bacterium]